MQKFAFAVALFLQQNRKMKNKNENDNESKMKTEPFFIKKIDKRYIKCYYIFSVEATENVSLNNLSKENINICYF